MQKLIFIAVVALIGAVHADSNPNDVHAEIVSYSSEINGDGSYAYDFATSNGINAQESGIGGHHAAGSNSYHSPEGQFIQTTYLADENGFQPQGEHLPTPPPIPYQILESLEYIRTHPPYEEALGQLTQAGAGSYNTKA